MWIHHLFSFLGTVLGTFVEAIGTSYLGLVAGIAFAVAATVASLWRIHRQQGREAMLAHWKEDAKIAWRVSSVCAVVIYLPILLFCFVKTVYVDHQSLVQAVTVAGSILQQTKSQCEAQATQLRIEKAGLVGQNGTLLNQNRDQQNSINNCQTEAIRRMRPEPEKVITYPISELPGPKAKTFIMLTNKTTSPATILVTCDGPITDLQGAPINTTIMTYSPASPAGNNSWVFTIASPPWAPDYPIVVWFKYPGVTAPNCGFQRR